MLSLFELLILRRAWIEPSTKRKTFVLDLLRVRRTASSGIAANSTLQIAHFHVMLLVSDTCRTFRVLPSVGLSLLLEACTPGSVAVARPGFQIFGRNLPFLVSVRMLIAPFPVVPGLADDLPNLLQGMSRLAATENRFDRLSNPSYCHCAGP